MYNNSYRSGIIDGIAEFFNSTRIKNKVKWHQPESRIAMNRESFLCDHSLLNNRLSIAQLLTERTPASSCVSPRFGLRVPA